MQALLITASVAFILSGLMLILKAIEVRKGMPSFIVNCRRKTDEVLLNSGQKTSHYFYFKLTETKQALSRTPHLFIHLFYVLRDKFRNRFSHYIDEVKGKKRVTDKTSNSEFLNAVKSYKEESNKGLIE